jgi:AcrR family transcriptional regulator
MEDVSPVMYLGGMTSAVNEDAAARPAAEIERPLRRDAERNRLRILQAARELFAARGLDVTLDDIARQAGVGVGTVYRRYPSREHLVEALFSAELDDVIGWGQEALADPDAWNGLTRFIERASALLVADRGLQDVMFSRTYGQDHVARGRARIVPMVETLIERCHAEGVIRSDVVGADLGFIQFMLAALIEYSEEVRPGLWRRYLTILLDGLRPAPGSLPVAAPGVEVLEEIQTRWRPPRRSPAPSATNPR